MSREYLDTDSAVEVWHINGRFVASTFHGRFLRRGLSSDKPHNLAQTLTSCCRSPVHQPRQPMNGQDNSQQVPLPFTTMNSSK